MQSYIFVNQIYSIKTINLWMLTITFTSLKDISQTKLNFIIFSIQLYLYVKPDLLSVISPPQYDLNIYQGF